MAMEIRDDLMTSDLTDVTAQRVQTTPDRWTVTGRHGLYDRNQAITAMTIAELRARTPAPNTEILIANREQELLIPPLPRDPWALLQTMRNAARQASSLTSQPEFDGPPFLGDLAEIAARSGETAGYVGGLVERVVEIVADMSEGAHPDDETAPFDVRHWAGAETHGVRAVALLREAAEHLQHMHREAAAAQHLGAAAAAS
ncbi:hypothetical protein JOL79_06795 [Microbispora sp. RL4-1S]|uniref:Uncharacterized protein n=1 Tax=Microbispora oryzae TaxID=2806554 RepID=A0A940WDH5_9ACTN|nr:hypothetical protein [Microbispora oryzae]MBP2703505.1 hypothetical protein [Microbispora oryzae]